MDSRLKVINSQVGYRPGHGMKRIIVADVPEARSIFGSAVATLMEQNRFSMEPLNSPSQHEYVTQFALTRQHTDFGTWLAGDFSEVREPGVYQAFCSGGIGPTFAIRDDVWCRILPELIRYFQVQSCGRNVPGWHEACHLDDGYCPERDLFVEAAGGWHDAGDFRKWVSSTSMNAISLLVAHRLWNGREEKLGLAPGLFLAEAMQGVYYFLNMQDPQTGMLYNNVGGGRRSFHDNEDNRFTDNIPRSGDERRINCSSAGTSAKYTLLFALYAEILRDTNPDLSNRCLLAARKSAEYDASENDQTADALQWRAWGYLELWRVTGEDGHKSAALAAMTTLLDLQVTDYIRGQKLTRGFFRAHTTDPGYHRKHVGADYKIWAIAEFITEWPDHPDAPRWRDAISMWFDDYIKIFADRNPFGLVPYSMYPEPSLDHPHCNYRQLGDGIYFRYFMADNPFGVNARNSLTAAALAAAARVLGRPEMMDYGYRLLEWVVGANPYSLSTVNGVGVLQPCALSFQMGNIPGGVTMGIGGDDNDMPSYHFGNHPWSCCDEYYGYQTSQFLWGIVALEDLSW
jgi:hypothetical protein